MVYRVISLIKLIITLKSSIPSASSLGNSAINAKFK